MYHYLPECHKNHFLHEKVFLCWIYFRNTEQNLISENQYNKIVNVYDPKINQQQFLKNEIKRISKSVLKFYNIKKLNLKNINFKNSIKDAVKDADLIQENAPENIKIKKKIVKEISQWSKKNCIIASSSSGLLPTKIQSTCYFPERFIIAHPFNPVYLLPLVELVRGEKTKNAIVKKCELFYWFNSGGIFVGASM